MNIQCAGLDLIRNLDKLYDWMGLKQSPGTAVTKTTQAAKAPFVQKPKKEKDLFLEGFYSVADKPKEERRSYTSPLAKSRAILDSISQTKPAKRVVEEEEDDFLKGFYSVADRPKVETPISAQPPTVQKNTQTTYKPINWIRSTMTQPNLWYAKNTDLSPQKVNYAQSDNTQIADNISTVTKGIGSGLHTNPLTGTPYKIIDRYEVYDRYKNMPQYINKNGKSILQKPDGRFGIASKKYPDITTNNRVNAVYRIDFSDNNTPYPHRNLNQHFAEEYFPKRMELVNKVINPQISSAELANKRIAYDQFVNDVFANKAGAKLGKGMQIADHKPVSKSVLDLAENSTKISKAAKVGGTALGVVSGALDLMTVGGAVSDDWKDDNHLGKDSVKALARVGGENLGALAGAKGGAAIGAWIGGIIGGAASGGLLAAPAAAIGGMIGGFLGGVGGSYLGGWLLEEGTEAILD